jgi:RepB DNA-primase from phage plasmid
MTATTEPHRQLPPHWRNSPTPEVVGPLSEPTVDLACATRFLDLLDDAGGFTFQTFLDSDFGRHSAAARPCVLHGSLDQYAAQLTTLNEQGAGIFVMVNAGDGVVHASAKTCRVARNVRRVRAVFVDLDGAPIAPVLESALLPDWIVQSSPGRWHAYWKVEDCPLGEFSDVQAALAAKYKGDPTVKDLPRVMRVPGFVHRKAQPFCSQLWQPADYQQMLKDPS